MGGFESLFWFIVTVGIIVLVVYWMRGKKGLHCPMHHFCGGGAGSALEILRERYVKGEIDKEEFEEKRKTLEN